MKTFNKTILVLMAVLAISLTSCSSDDDGGEDPSGGTGTFSAKVDETTFTSLEGTVAGQLTSSGPTKVLAISAGTSKSENLQMIVTTFDGVGTYDLNFTNIGTYSFLPDPSNPDPNTVVIYSTANGQPSNGQLKVSSYEGNVVKGTFSFTAYNLNNTSQSVSVTEGEYNIEVVVN
ncbi:hypothetical protein Aeqsu_1819 [Aequorivita sublithincola DSM 14238]|uniref:Uncharacterized protein n=1 Tax=Aequorivita sublithincola (strain DSM 14238 / LMG 21431 / ACAM 643 / 9-3) TaxID=746697 RepID=I3YWD0_AEQSU|nr:DUF6252 family protein [Aequorivita sublithincola]AFL81298.1 hypothetical protein Aeqsu_1819 [Aequorivita sublithincola DSM 14238]